MTHLYPTQRPSFGQRIPEFLDNLKVEYESLAHDLNMYKMQKDDYERKLQAQLTELNSIQQTLFDLERNHSKLKQQYEEEIVRLRRQLEMQTGTAPSIGVNIGSRTQGSMSDSKVSINSNGSSFTYPAPSITGPSSSNPGSSQTGSLNLPNISSGPMSATNLPSLGDGKRSMPMPPSVTTLASVNSNSSPATGTKRTLEEPFYPSSSSKTFLPLTPVEKKQHTENPQPEAEEKSKPERRPENGEKGKIMERFEGTEGGSDWIVGYNPSIQTNLNIDLMHSLDHNSVVCCVKFSHDGKYLASGCNKSAQIYDVETGEKIHNIYADELGKEGDLYIRSVCFSPDGRYLALGAEDKTVKIWDIEKKRIHHTFLGHELDIYSLDFSKDGNFIVSGSGDKKAKIWDVEKAECLFTLGNEEVGPKDGVTSVAFSPDGRLVAAGSLDRIVRLWDAQTGYFLERYEGHNDSVYSVAFSPDGKTLASGSLDKTLKLWEIAGSRSRARCKSTFTGHKDFVLSVAFSPDGNWLISGSKDRSVQFWDPRSAVTHMMLQGHKNSVISVAVSPTGGVFATGSGDFRARVWKYD